MLGRNSSNKTSNTDGGSVNLIGNGTKIIGDISSNGDVRIDGNLVGNLVTTGKFVLGPNGVIEGNVTSGNADLSGEIKGIVNVSEMLLLKSTAKINGDIVTGKLAIEPGALFTGSCNMGAKVKNMQAHSEKFDAAKTA
ncbi:MAG: polymer-forming cytoskeletal protein [Bacteroidota bacterium]|nr:polymer-forming cytoskeletal protein [Bacteroidota bacterium]